MGIYARKDSQYFWIRFTAPDGRRIQKSTGLLATPDNKSKAREFLDREKARHWDIANVTNKTVYRWEQAALRFVEETKHKRDHPNDKRKLKFMTQLLNVPLDQINSDLVHQVLQQKLKRDASGNTLPYQPTFNRHIALVTAVLNKAVRWGWLDRVPYIARCKEVEGRIRWITFSEADRLVAELRKNAEHLGDMAEFTLATGLRESNVRLLEWSQVDLQRRVAWIHADQAKGKRSIPVPLNSDAILILRRWLLKHNQFVFVFRGKPVGKCSTKAWIGAKQRAGISNFRWHDLRHTWASWHVQAGTPLVRLMELGGWRSYEMVLRYAHLSPEHLREDSDRIVRNHGIQLVEKNSGTFSGTFRS